MIHPKIYGTRAPPPIDLQPCFIAMMHTAIIIIMQSPGYLAKCVMFALMTKTGKYDSVILSQFSDPVDYTNFFLGGEYNYI